MLLGFTFFFLCFLTLIALGSKFGQAGIYLTFGLATGLLLLHLAATPLELKESNFD